MLNNSIIALSAAAAGISAAGALTVIRTDGDIKPRGYLFITFVLFAGITSLPLVITFIPDLYVYYLPVIFPMLFALPPAIYRYIAMRTAQDQQAIAHWRDALLPLAGALITIGFWLLPKTSRATMLIQGELPPDSPFALALALTTFVLILFWSVLSIGYLVATIKRLRTFRSHLKNLYSNTKTYELRWIDWLIVFLIVLCATTVTALLSDNFGAKPLFSAELVYTLTSLLLLFLIAFISTSSPTDNFEAVAIETNNEDESINKYARSALSEDHAKRLAERIKNAMRDDELYLDASLSLKKLSKRIGALPNMVSQTLNDEIGSTFYDYVAHWRIEAAKPLIVAGETSILAISLEVGFNSRSTFYKAFKRETGMTPRAYRVAKSALSYT